MEKVVPEIWYCKRIGFGRSNLLFTVCPRCQSTFIPYDREVFCDECADTTKSQSYYGIDVPKEIVGFEQRTEASLSRRNYNYSKVRKRDGDMCMYCGWVLDLDPDRILHIDHINPFVGGGSNSMTNLVVSCNRCNLIANDKVFEGFDEKREFIREQLREKDIEIFGMPISPFD